MVRSPDRLTLEKGMTGRMPLSGAAARVIRHYGRRSHASVQSHTCIDLFSGAGGLAQGFREAGFSVLSGTDLDGAAGMDEIYEALGELGYECDGRVLYSEDYGVPQERRRVFLVATRLGWEDALFPRGCAGPAAKPLAGTNPYVHRWAREPGELYR